MGTKAKAKPKLAGTDLRWHPTGGWCKKHAGRIYYFGKDDAEAKRRWPIEWPRIVAGEGRFGKQGPESTTVRDICNDFLRGKEAKCQCDELSNQSFKDYYRTAKALANELGDRAADSLTPEDFAKLRQQLAKRLKAVSLGNEINRIRIILKWGYDSRLIDRPPHYGQSFDRPSKKILKKIKGKEKPKIFTADDILTILGDASPAMKAMVLLGINCGFGNADCGRLTFDKLDLEKGWVSFPRPKTGEERECPLWPETVAAINEYLAVRPKPFGKRYADIVFLTAVNRHPYWRELTEGRALENVGYTDSIGGEFTKILKRRHINGRKGLGFYSLRHTTETIGGESIDQVAVNLIMGHSDNSMAANYRHGVSEDRLLAVTGLIRAWLYQTEGAKE